MSLSLWTRLFNWKQIRRSPSPSSFTVSAAESASTVDKGTTRVVRLTVAYAGARYGGTLTPSTNSLPSGVTASFSPATLTAANGFTDMSLIVDAGAGSITDDAYTVTFSGTGISPKTINQTVTVPSPTPPQSISIAPDDDTVTVAQGSTVDITYTLTRVGAYTADVPLAVTGLPSGVTAAYPDGQTYQGSDQTKRVRLTADIAASTVTNDAFTTTAAGDGGSVSDATDSGTVTVTAYVAPPAATPYRFDAHTYADQAAFLANEGTLASGKLYTVIDDFTTRLTVDDTVTYNGSKSLRYRFSGGVGGTPRVVTHSLGLDNFWIAYRFKWTRGFSLNLNNGVGGAAAHKLNDFGFNGQQGRILSAITNGQANVPGADDNGGDLQTETQTRTLKGIFLNCTLRGVNNGSSKLFTDEQWYVMVQHFERVSSHHYRNRVFFGLDSATPPLLGTINARDGYNSAPTSIGEIQFPCTFNRMSGAPPATGIDQSLYMSPWETYNEDTDPDPFGLGYDDGTVDFSFTLSNDTFTIARGASDSATITSTLGSGLTGRTLTYQNADSTQQTPNLWISVDRVMTGAVPTATVTVLAGVSCVPGVYTHHVRLLSTQRTGYGVASYSLPITITVT